MDISIKWQRIHAQEQCADSETKPVLLKMPVWEIFPIEDLLKRSRNHALNLFKRNIPVIIKEDGAIISNSMEMRNLYRRKGFRIYDLESIQPSTGLLQDVGFLSDA